MKAKDLKKLFNQFDDEQEITFFSSYWDAYDDYEGSMTTEEDYQCTIFLTEHDTVMIVPSGADTRKVKAQFKGMTLYELIETYSSILKKPLWLKLLQENNNAQEG